MLRRFGLVLVLVAAVLFAGSVSGAAVFGSRAADASGFRLDDFDVRRGLVGLGLGRVADEAGVLLDAVIDDAMSVSVLERPFFVGNSLVEGLRLNSDDGFDFWCEVGISLRELLERVEFPDGFDCVVVEMGSNELGVYDEDEFTRAYGDLVRRFDVPVFCLSVPPVCEAKSRYAPRVNDTNVAVENVWLRDICNATGATFVDCADFFGDDLDPSWTGDGLHLRPEVYAAWYEWVLARVGVATG